MKKTLAIILILIFCMTNHIKATDIPTKEEKEFYDHLFKLVSQGEIDSVKHILENQKVDLSKYDNDEKHYTPIMYAAAWRGNIEMMQYLIDKGANPGAKTSSDETALHRTAWNGNLDAVKLLVENGADPNIIYSANGGLSPLCCAAESGSMETVKYLIGKGANINYTNTGSGASPLRSAAYKAHYDIFLLLAQKQPATYNWQEALFYGLIGGNLDIVKYIVEKRGANVNRKSKIWDEYPIQKAADNRFVDGKNAQPVEIIKYLVSKGARLSNINNGNVFLWAMENSNEATMEYLIEQGIKVDIPVAKDGWTPLALALDNSNFAVAKYLIKTTKNYTFRDMPLVLFFADGMYNSPAVIELLIKEGVNKEHYTQAFGACITRNDSVSAHLLLDAGADIKVLNADSSNVLHVVRSYPVAKFLIEKGADIHNKVMLDNAWRNPPLLEALQEANITPVISQTEMNLALAKAAQLGDVWTLEYMLKRGAEVNSYQLAEEQEQEEQQEPERNTNLTEEQQEERERYQEQYNDDKPVYKQTPLIINTNQGYSRCDYGNYNDRNSKVQVSPRIAEILLDAGADLNIADSRGRTALHHAAGSQFCRTGMWPIPMGTRRDREHGAHGDPAAPPLQYHDSTALLLIKSGANLDAKDRNGNTPLILAAINRNHDVMKMLLEAKADISIKNNRGKDVFSYLDHRVSFGLIKEAGLWKHIPQSRLNTAFRKFFTDYRPRSEYDVEELKALISYGADVNTKIYPSDSTNALMYTFDRMYGDNKLEIAQVLIDGGIDLNAEDRSGYTLPMILIKKGKDTEQYSDNKEPVNLDFLIKNNIDLNYKTNTQYTILSVAICENRKEATSLLLKHGAKRDRQAEWWYLMKERHYDRETMPMLRQLVKEGVDVNMQSSTAISRYVPLVNQKGVTALMLFAAYGNEDSLKALLQMGADVNLKAADGATALVIAKDRRNQKIVDILIQAGAK